MKYVDKHILRRFIIVGREKFVRSDREESVLNVKSFRNWDLGKQRCNVKADHHFILLYLIVSLKLAEFLTYEGVCPTGGEMILARYFAR